MSLNITLTNAKCPHCGRSDPVFEGNITHNLNKMAEEAGVYDVVWRPDENGIETAGQLIEPLKKAIREMEADPDRFKKFNPSNGWGSYEGLLVFFGSYLAACVKNPDATIDVWR